MPLGATHKAQGREYYILLFFLLVDNSNNNSANMPPRRQRRRRRSREGNGSDSDEDDEEEEVVYGIRRSRRATTWEYRDSSAVDPAQRMEQDVHYSTAEDLLQQSFMILSIIASLFTAREYLLLIIRRWQAMGGRIVINTIERARAKTRWLKKTINHLLFVLSWVRACGEIALLYAEDLTVFIRDPNNRFKPHQYRTIDEIDRRDCYSWFGVSPHGLRMLYLHWRIPETFQAPRSRHQFGGEECFLVFLYHLMEGMPFTMMARHQFGGDPRYLSLMFEVMINHLYITFYNKISGTSLSQWIPEHVDLCRELIHNALSGGAIEETTIEGGQVVDRQLIIHNFELESFRLFGFLDDFAVPTARPAGPRGASRPDVQRAFYSGYLRRHGLKAQVVYLPIGIIGSVYITELRQNDNGTLNISGLNNYLVQLLRGFLVDGLFPALFCDGIFAVLATIVPRFRNPSPELQLLNQRLNGMREIIEHIFADHRNRFPLFNVPQHFRLFNHGVKVRRLTLVSFFVLNSYYCLQGTRCQFFGHIAPTLAVYLPLNEVLQPPPHVNLGSVYNFASL